MQGSLDQPPVVIRPARLMLLPIVTTPIAMAVMVIVILMTPSFSKTAITLPIVGGTSMMVFLVGLIVIVESLAVALLAGFWVSNRLELGQDGLSRRSLGGQRRYAWNEIDQIVVKLNNDRYRTSSVRLRFKPFQTAPRAQTREVNLTGIWEVRPEPLAKILTDARDRWGLG